MIIFWLIQDRRTSGKATEEYKVFNSLIADISSCIQDPVHLAVELFQEKLISDSVYSNVTGRELLHIDKISTLMQCVLSMIQQSADNLYVLIGILEKDRTLTTLCHQLKAKCSKGTKSQPVQSNCINCLIHNSGII